MSIYQGVTPAALKDSNRTINSQSPTGRVIWQDTFGLGDFSTFGWVSGVAVETQVGGITERSFMRSMSGSRASLHVFNPISNAMKTAPNFPNYDFFLQWWDGTNRMNGGLLFAPTTTPHFAVTTTSGGVSIAGTSNPIPAFDDSTALYGTEHWYNHKLIMDIQNRKFVTLICRDGIFDLSQLSNSAILATGDTSVPAGMFRAGVACNTDASTPAAGMEVYVGVIIVTQES